MIVDSLRIIESSYFFQNFGQPCSKRTRIGCVGRTLFEGSVRLRFPLRLKEFNGYSRFVFYLPLLQEYPSQGSKVMKLFLFSSFLSCSLAFFLSFFLMIPLSLTITCSYIQKSLTKEYYDTINFANVHLLIANITDKMISKKYVK